MRLGITVVTPAPGSARGTDTQSSGEPRHPTTLGTYCTCGVGRSASSSYSCATCDAWDRLLRRLPDEIEARRHHTERYSLRGGR